MGRNPAEITIGIAMGFDGPAVVVAHFVVIPHLIIAVVWIVDAVMMFGATRSQDRYGGGG
jgi:hypothetical protein